jgi:hypothetical protein
MPAPAGMSASPAALQFGQGDQQQQKQWRHEYVTSSGDDCAKGKTWGLQRAIGHEGGVPQPQPPPSPTTTPAVGAPGTSRTQPQGEQADAEAPAQPAMQLQVALMEVIQMQAEQANGRRRYQRCGSSMFKWVVDCSGVMKPYRGSARHASRAS